jgi:ppGpp synthetase/RelA/SpoT-type nucleotidyltranferase
MSRFSKTQIDKLGERLREVDLTDDDLRILDEYRRSFEPAYQQVVGIIRDTLKLNPTGRPAKSTSSIIDKLRREKTRGYRFSQIQDIAGCRILMNGLAEQDVAVGALVSAFPAAKVDDLRESPSNGYRAVHVIVSLETVRVEIQIRSRLQHLWAELCEKLSDSYGPMIKYGGGPEKIRKELDTMSSFVRKVENLESRNLQNKGVYGSAWGELSSDLEGELTKLRDDIIMTLQKAINLYDNSRDSKQESR